MAFIKNPEHPELPVCRNLRTKASYVPDMQDAHFMEVHHPYAQYYCLKTLYPVGPDDDIACPEECTAKRVCFKALVNAQVA